jgi:hypothetical protein
MKMNPATLLGMALGAALLASRRRSEEQSGLCGGSPPSAQPKVPAGFRIARTRATKTAIAEAKAALKLPLGSFTTFQDEDGVTRGILLSWHCHEPEEGVTPVGWHKGSTLCEPTAPAISGILDMDPKADAFGPGYFLPLGWTGREWRWGRQFTANSTGQAMGTMRLLTARGERQYLYRWIPADRRWGRVA